MIKSYSELIQLPTFLERFNYLKLGGFVGDQTFGYDRYLNQIIYRSPEWKRFRRDIILRDNGCDLGMEGYELYGKILVHHINPITLEDINNKSYVIFDPNNVISCSMDTHNAIHYGDASLLVKDPVVRMANDTSPWKK